MIGLQPSARRLAMGVLAACTVLAAPAAAQSLRTGDDGQAGKGAVEITADDGIEWQRDTKAYVASGNARATRQGLEVWADRLTAYYREGKEEQQQIFRVEAEGSVRVRSAEETAYGDKGVYNVDDAVFVLVGNGLRLETPEFRLTARDSLEYWEARQLAVARGEAIVTKDDRRLSADVLTAHVVDETGATAVRGSDPTAARRSGATDGPGRSAIRRIDALGNVVVATPTEVATGDEGVYNVGTGIATLCGNVKITRGKNQLNGECAEVDLNSGRSRLIGSEKRVRSLIVPNG